MKAAHGCALFGACQAVGGVMDGVILLHSVVGCNFGTMAFHLTNDMQDIRQTCTVISDNDVVFGGEASLKKAIILTLEHFKPKALFVVSGCVSSIIADDIQSVIDQIQAPVPIIYIEAAGFCKSEASGFEDALTALKDFIKPPSLCKEDFPRINLLGLGRSDPRLGANIKAFEAMLNGQVKLQTAFSQCTWEQIIESSNVSLNLIVGQGKNFAQAVQNKFGIDFECIDMPYGICGMQSVYNLLGKKLSIDFSKAEEIATQEVVEGAKKIYPYLQAMRGMPVAVIGKSAYADGMSRFLRQELGMQVVCFAHREKLSDLEVFFEDVRKLHPAMVFGSSFEQQIADELNISLVRYDGPVFDEICLTDSPFIGVQGTLQLIETIINNVWRNRSLKGAFYQ